MTTRGALHSSCLISTTNGRIAMIVMYVAIICVPLSAEYSFAQENGGGAVVGQNPDDHSLAGSDRQESSSQTTLTNAPSAAASYRPPSELTLGDRFTIYRNAVLRPYSLVGPAFGAGIGQWEDEPPEWGEGATGYGRRFASGMSRHLISETIRFGFAAVDGEDPRYHRSQDTGVWKRTEHAIVETFTSETPSGSRMPAYSRFAGTYGAAFISNAWYPDSRATAGWALRRGSTALASSVGFHLFEEFLPRKYFKAIGVSNDTSSRP